MAMRDTVLVDELYPMVVNSITKNISKYKKCLSRFMDKRAKELYAVAPLDRIYFGADDLKDFYDSMQIEERKVTEILSKTYYWSFPSFNPAAAKDEFTMTVMMMIRYFYLKKMSKELELTCLYLAFSGKFYPSIHYGSYKKFPPSEYEHIMMYVVNNSLSNKYDIKSEGSVLGAIRSICNTWIDSYDRLLKSDDTEDFVYLVQQLHNRIKSFMKNIATEYYKAYENKDYLTYDSDNLSEDNYRLADNDSLKAERITERAIEYINSTGVDYKICKMASDNNVRTDEIKAIIESILSDNDNMILIRELISLIVITYFAQSKTKDVRDIDFITYSIAPKPNAKNKDILRQKEIVEELLNENSMAYKRRKSRIATKNSYYKSIFAYFTLVINTANK